MPASCWHPDTLPIHSGSHIRTIGGHKWGHFTIGNDRVLDMNHTQCSTHRCFV